MTDLVEIPQSADDPYDFQPPVIARCLTTVSRRALLVSGTGTGKTVMACEVVKDFADRHQPVLILAHTREIIFQIQAKLAARGVYAGIILAGVDPHPMRPVQIASIQTLASRSLRGSTALPPAALIVVDEAHHSRADTYQKIFAAYPDAKFIGLTATPCRGDGRGLGDDYDELVEAPQVAEMIKRGVLVRPIYYTTPPPDLKGVRIQAGDYAVNDLADRVNRPQIVGDTVTHYLKYGQGRKGVCYAVNVAHSIHIADEFNRQGVKAAHIDGGTPKAERDAILKQLADGEIQVVVNCMVLTEGWDCPAVGCVILARPTKQLGMYLQMVGRGLRASPGQTDCIVLDHAGAVHRLGRVDDPITWTLEPDNRAVNKAHEKRKRDGVEPCTCIKCGAARFGGMACDECGFLPQRQGKPVDVLDGELGLLEFGNVKERVYSHADKVDWIAQLNHIVLERGKDTGSVYHLYIAKFGAKPPVFTKGVPPRPPTPEMRSYYRSRMIAFAKSRAA